MILPPPSSASLYSFLTTLVKPSIMAPSVAAEPPIVAVPTKGPTNGTVEQAPSKTQKESAGFHWPARPTFASLEEERESRKERLALAFRVFGMLGFDEGVAGHLTYRDPILKDHFWVNPFGVNFRLMTKSDLLLIGPDGKIKGGGKPDGQYYNAAAYAIHHAIHTARPDIDAACHSHSLHGKAFSTLGRNIEITTQDSCVFHNQCALYENFGGVVLGEDESGKIAETLGQHNKALILQNHGILTAGETIESAVMWFVMLERHCQVQLLADAAAGSRGQKPIVIDDAEAEFTHKMTGNEVAGHFFARPLFAQARAEYKDAHLA